MKSSPGPIQLSVVVPVYNEQRQVPETIRKISAFLTSKRAVWEAIFVDDGSIDDTARVLQSVLAARPDLPIRVIHGETHRGKGHAARQGMLEAKGRYVLLTDADLSTPMKEVDKLTAILENGSDVAIGSRVMGRAGAEVQQSFMGRISRRIFDRFVRTLLLPGIRDSQCGFKCFTREAAQVLFSVQKLDGFRFDVEVLYLARQMGLKVVEVPVMWRQGEGGRVPLLRDTTRLVQDLFKIRRLHA